MYFGEGHARDHCPQSQKRYYEPNMLTLEEQILQLFEKSSLLVCGQQSVNCEPTSVVCSLLAKKNKQQIIGITHKIQLRKQS